MHWQRILKKKKNSGFVNIKILAKPMTKDRLKIILEKHKNLFIKTWGSDANIFLPEPTTTNVQMTLLRLTYSIFS